MLFDTFFHPSTSIFKILTGLQKASIHYFIVEEAFVDYCEAKWRSFVKSGKKQLLLLAELLLKKSHSESNWLRLILGATIFKLYTRVLTALIEKLRN